MDTIEWAIKNYGTVSIVVTAVIGLLVRFRKFISDATLSFRFSNGMFSTFGNTPDKALKEIIESLQTAHDVLEVRLSTTERYLRIGIYVCNLEGECIITNDILCEIFGIDSSEMLGWGWLQAVHADDRRRVNDEWLYSIKNHISYNCLYTVCNQREKKAYSVRTSAIAIVDDLKVIHCYVGFIEVKNTKSLDCCFSEDA